MDRALQLLLLALTVSAVIAGIAVSIIGRRPPGVTVPQRGSVAPAGIGLGRS